MSQSAGALENLFFDLSARTKLKLGGADRVRFLNGQISNDLSKATETEAIEATVLTAKGKMDGHIVLTARGDEYLIDADPELREKLRPRLERYAISDDIEMVDVTGEFSIFHVLTKPPAVTGQCQVVASNRFRQAGWDIWVPMNGRDEIFTQLAEAYSFCDDPCMEIFRVE